MRNRFTFIFALVISSMLIAGCSKNDFSLEATNDKTSSEKYYMQWTEAKNLAQIIADHCKTLPKFKGILAISRGGLPPAAVLGQKLGIKNIRVICLESYSEEKELGSMKEIYIPKDITDNGEGWLVVDDIADSGTTLQYTRKLYPKAYYVTLVSKPIGKPHANFSAKDYPQNTWIVFPWEDK